MRGRIKPKTKAKFRDGIRDVIKGLGRKVLVYKHAQLDAPTSCVSSD